MSEVIEEWAVEYPDHHHEENFITADGAREWLKQHPHPGAIIVGRLHLIGDWTPEE